MQQTLLTSTLLMGLAIDLTSRSDPRIEPPSQRSRRPFRPCRFDIPMNVPVECADTRFLHYTVTIPAFARGSWPEGTSDDLKRPCSAPQILWFEYYISNHAGKILSE